MFSRGRRELLIRLTIVSEVDFFVDREASFKLSRVPRAKKRTPDLIDHNQRPKLNFMWIGKHLSDHQGLNANACQEIGRAGLET